MFAMSFNTSTNMGNNIPGSLNNGMVNSNVLMGIGGPSFHNSGNACECPICKGPTWAMGRVCEHCKTNMSRWHHMPLISLGLDFSDVCMLKTQLSELERQEERLRLQLQSGQPVSGSANRFVVKGFMR